MVKYAKAIQSVQEDMGLKTTSFPHLGLYGDIFVLNNKKGERAVFEDHSKLKQKQEQFEKWQAENSKKIQQKLLKPDMEKGESIVTFVDDFGPDLMDPAIDNNVVPDLLESEDGEKLLTIIDDTPFHKRLQRPNKNKGEAILIIADDIYLHEMEENEETVPDLLEPDEEKGEEVVVITDDIPFQS